MAIGQGEGTIKYTISGEGAGTIFIIDELTGDIHATERLDREEKAFYTLRAQARERLSSDPLEPESEFVIKCRKEKQREARKGGGEAARDEVDGDETHAQKGGAHCTWMKGKE
ncbi:hypothetical protein CRUP_006719 [Coryphaenoides rupestris]|nr:hypothetical protein CRUP_006719 [Coryphaenoides rupestris]